VSPRAGLDRCEKCRLHRDSIPPTFVARPNTEVKSVCQIRHSGNEISLTAIGRDSSVSETTRYGLNSPGIESQWGVRFSALVQTGLGPTQPPIQ
jgi:hypothetical protein